ncbi:MAG TPA: hypothetical protein VFI34_02830 [Candidatus Limnocylindrales bacterium]|nr:hypothetical protein [Candidatus Limnocylindrales bacterium]
MQSFQNDQLWLIQALRAEDIRRANDARRFQATRSSIRRAIGTSIVRLGTRLAGDPGSYELARSR